MLSYLKARMAITVADAARAQKVMRILQQELGAECTVYEMEGWGSQPKPRLITVLPTMCDKGKAAEYVRNKLHAEKSECLCAGDTKGDLTMFTAGFNCVSVANASNELLEAVQGFGNAEMHYHAQCNNAAGILPSTPHGASHGACLL